MPARMPDFLGIGTQKGGTTTLHQWLGKHPEIYMPSCKELHFFNKIDKKSKNWYSKQFENAQHNQKCGEITPYYLFHDKTPKEIKILLPKVKLIILLRNPVERAISQYYHSYKRGFEILDIQKAFAAEEERMRKGGEYSHQKHSYIGRSKYIDQLARYEKEFNKDQILIIKSEDMFTQQKKCWKRLTNFLGVKETVMKNKIPICNYNELKKEIPKITKDFIEQELEETITEIHKKYGIDWRKPEQST